MSSMLKRCVVTIDVYPGLRGRVCKVDGDVVVSMAGWLAAGPVPRAEHRHPTAAAGGEVVGVHASRMHNTPRRTLCRSWHTPWPRHRRRYGVVYHRRLAEPAASPRGWRHTTGEVKKYRPQTPTRYMYG